MKKIIIPRNPNTVEINYIKEVPFQVCKIISDEEWSSAIEDINSLFKSKDRITFSSFLMILLIVPYLLLPQRKYDDSVDSHFKKLNERYKPFGIYFCNPKYIQYMELEVVLNDKEAK